MLSVLTALVACSAPSFDVPLATQGTLLLPRSVHLLSLQDGPGVTDAPAGSVGWDAGGVVGGALTGAFALALVGLGIDATLPADYTPSGTSRAQGLFWGGALAGAVAGGVGGYFLGEAARRGSLGAKLGIVLLDVVGAVAFVVVTGLALSAASFYTPN